MSKRVFINTDKIHTKANPAILNFINSDRSDGKTTDIATRAWRGYQTDGHARVLLRRTCGEVSTGYINTLFTILHDAQKRGDIEGVGKLTAKGKPKEDGVHLYSDGKYFMRVVPLSRAYAIKGSMDYANEHDLFFDEYQPLNRRFLNDEVTLIFAIYKTIDRGHNDTRIFIYSNRVCVYNPLFAFFDIVPKNGLTDYKNGMIKILQISNKGNQQEEKKSPFGRLIEGTPLDDYYTGGGYIATELPPIATEKPRGAPFIELYNKGHYYGIFKTKSAQCVVMRLNARANPATPAVVLTPTNDIQRAVTLNLCPYTLSQLKTLYRSNRLACDKEQTYHELKELFKML